MRPIGRPLPCSRRSVSPIGADRAKSMDGANTIRLHGSPNEPLARVAIDFPKKPMKSTMLRVRRALGNLANAQRVLKLGGFGQENYWRIAM